MKKLLLSLFLFFGFFLIFSPHQIGADCNFNGNIKSSLDGCFGGSTVNVVTTTGDLNVAGGLKDQILKYNRIISGILGLIAVGSIVYGGLMFVLSGGADDRVTKGKKIIQWAIIGLLLLVAASSIVAVVVNIVFGIES